MEPERPIEPDDFQKAWRTQSSRTRLTVDAEQMLQEVQLAERQFRAMIFWRDFREVVIALLMIPMWFLMGALTSQPWTWYLTVPVLVWIAVFMLVYRKLYVRRPSEPSQPLLDCVKNSLTEVEAQIWLLRNVFWWYLLPPSTSLMTYFVHISWLAAGWGFFVLAGFAGLFLFVVYRWVYRLNQRAVCEQLEPRRQDLLKLVASLEDDTTGEGSQDLFDLVSGLSGSGLKSKSPPSQKKLVTEDGYAKVAPYAGVRWENDRPIVQVQGRWSPLVSIDGIPIDRIMDFANKEFGDKARKRFAEDLVEVLSKMGHLPQWNVTLGLATKDGQVEQLEITMTEENRNLVRE